MEKSKVKFEAMKPERFQAWAAAQSESYAAEKVKSGAWPADGALERAKNEFLALLPDGLNTPLTHILDIWAVIDSPHASRAPENPIGAVWLTQGPFGREAGHAWIFDVEIDTAFRGRGYGRATMMALEEYARAQGITEIGLHVFGHNTVAANLYRAVGYETTSLTMRKIL